MSRVKWTGAQRAPHKTDYGQIPSSAKGSLYSVLYIENYADVGVESTL